MIIELYMHEHLNFSQLDCKGPKDRDQILFPTIFS